MKKINLLKILLGVSAIAITLSQISCKKQPDNQNSNAAPPSLSNGLVAWYPFTGNANDSSGNENNGTVNGATLISGKSGFPNTAYSFNGTSNSINIPNPFMNGSRVDSFSFYCRFKINASGNYGIWGKTLFWGEINLFIMNDNSINLNWANSNGGNTYSEVRSAANSISINNWNDVVVNYSNPVLSVYINGVLANSTMSFVMQGGNLITNSHVDSECNFAEDAGSNRFGVETIGGVLTNYLNGSIDDFRLYNRCLTQSEISYLAAH
ncbi:MAG: LamG domain-containing protein [Bacteroidota bacterium]|nr:LamG domain-containing protein [Bacteroidota bacterium]